MWSPLTTLFIRMGFTAGQHLTSFLVLGRLTKDKVVTKNQSGMLFIAWRCLYAELVRGRIENVRPNIRQAYLRTLIMAVTRLRAYGERWLKWVNKNAGTALKSYIPRQHQNKTVLKQKGNGEYEICDAIFQEIRRLKP